MDRENGKPTIKQISAALGLSRNTVSKVLNGKDGVSKRTERLILAYANGQEEAAPSAPPAAGQTILFSYRQENIEYINGLLAGIEKTVKENGCLLALNIVDSAAPSGDLVPQLVRDGAVDGILSFNIYDVEYWEEILSAGIPAVFFDTLARRHLFAGRADIVCSENEQSIAQLMRVLAKEGRRRFAFYGDTEFCASLNERWVIFQAMLAELGLSCAREACILDDFSQIGEAENMEIVERRISLLRELPDAYICASDRQAILLLRVLNRLNIDVPGRIAVAGFDNLPESLRQSPPLTTIEANSEFMGEVAVKKLLERIKNPAKPFEYVRCGTQLILRASTGHDRKG